MGVCSVSKDDGLKPIDGSPYEHRNRPPDPNFENLIANWKHYSDRIVMFFGAGASVGARNASAQPLPTAFHLRNSIWKTFMASDPGTFQPQSIGLMSLEHTAALVERSAGRQALIRTLSEAFSARMPLWQHAVLPYLRPYRLFSTNYDALIEQGWLLHPSTEGLGPLRPYYKDEAPDSVTHIPLYKPHGTVERAVEAVGSGGLVITQFDYIEMLNYRRSALRRCLENLQGACVIFIGYSFQDLDIATALYEMRNPHQKRMIPWYAVFPRADDNVRSMYLDRYDVRQIDRTFFEFMVDLDEKLAFIPEPWKFKNIDALRGVEKTPPTNCMVVAQSMP